MHEATFMPTEQCDDLLPHLNKQEVCDIPTANDDTMGKKKRRVSVDLNVSALHKKPCLLATTAETSFHMPAEMLPDPCPTCFYRQQHTT